MWELLQKLEDLGWKPYGKSIAELTETEKNVRLLTSLSSGLWQFCVENKLVNKYADVSDEEEAYIGKWKSGLDAIDIDGDYIRLDDDYDEYHQDTDYKYWLIECALKDESELEQFLLSNIVIKDEE